jgi:integrase
MRGSIRKRGSTWTVTYDEPSADGRRKQRSKGGFATKRLASAFLTEALARLGDGTYAMPAKTTAGAFLVDEWLPAVTPTLRPLSVRKYENAIRLYIVPSIGATRLQALRGGHLNGLYAQLERDGLSVSTRRLVHAVVHRALRDAVRWGLLVRNPAAMADPPSRARSRAQAWTASELRRFLEHVADDPLFALWRLAATGGMRRGELAGLTWRALDLDGGRLTVEQQLVRPQAVPPSGRRSPAARGARSRSIPRPWTPCGPIATRSSSSATSPPAPTATATWCSPMRSADQSTRSASQSGSRAIARPLASRPAACTRSATPRPRSH